MVDSLAFWIAISMALVATTWPGPRAPSITAKEGPSLTTLMGLPKRIAPLRTQGYTSGMHAIPWVSFPSRSAFTKHRAKVRASLLGAPSPIQMAW